MWDKISCRFLYPHTPLIHHNMSYVCHQATGCCLPRRPVGGWSPWPLADYAARWSFSGRQTNLFLSSSFPFSWHVDSPGLLGRPVFVYIPSLRSFLFILGSSICFITLHPALPSVVCAPFVYRYLGFLPLSPSPNCRISQVASFLSHGPMKLLA